MATGPASTHLLRNDAQRRRANIGTGSQPHAIPNRAGNPAFTDQTISS